MKSLLKTKNFINLNKTHSYFKGTGSCIDLIQLIEHIGSSTQGHMKYDYPQLPWMTDNIKKSLKQRSKLTKIFYKSG